ncbi:hypothetical protein FRB95_014073 [Tulasnella sp. JGI-2019a]|nr:hypothetical protein FRB95_014073 [Tulasnella sp. JGI-2019a]
MWYQLDLEGRSPPLDNCCNTCNPDLLIPWRAPPSSDPRLTIFNADFIISLNPSELFGSSGPARSSADEHLEGGSQHQYAPNTNSYYALRCTSAQENALARRLELWREVYHSANYGAYTTAQMVLSDGQVDKMARSGNAILHTDVIDASFIRGLMKWDLVKEGMLLGVIEVLRTWAKDISKRTVQNLMPPMCTSVPFLPPSR